MEWLESSESSATESTECQYVEEGGRFVCTRNTGGVSSMDRSQIQWYLYHVHVVKDPSLVPISYSAFGPLSVKEPCMAQNV